MATGFEEDVSEVATGLASGETRVATASAGNQKSLTTALSGVHSGTTEDLALTESVSPFELEIGQSVPPLELARLQSIPPKECGGAQSAPPQDQADSSADILTAITKNTLDWKEGFIEIIEEQGSIQKVKIAYPKDHRDDHVGSAESLKTVIKLNEIIASHRQKFAEYADTSAAKLRAFASQRREECHKFAKEQGDAIMAYSYEEAQKFRNEADKMFQDLMDSISGVRDWVFFNYWPGSETIV